MASAFAHGFVAATVGKCLSGEKQPLRFWVLGIVCAIVPDADVITFAFGVGYGDFWGHRGFTHSLVFALLLALVVTFAWFSETRAFSRRWFVLVTYFFLCTASHGLLDGLTNGGLGVAFFSPFDNQRYFLPWRPIEVSPIGILNFFTSWGMRVIASELIWVVAPCVCLLLIVHLIRKRNL